MGKFYWLEEIEPTEVNLVGEKALALSQLGRLGYPIVPGFVIPTTTLKAFLKRLGESEPLLVDLADSSLYVDVDDYQALQKLTRHIRVAISATALEVDWLEDLSQEIKKLGTPTLIIRPSVTIPQKREEHLHGVLMAQVCRNDPKALERAIKQVWADLFSAKSLFYRQRMAIARLPVHCALLVQPLWKVVASGTLTTNEQTWSIQSSWGLGQSWVRGEVDPDTYSIKANQGILTAKHLGHKTRAYEILAPSESRTNPLDVIALTEAQQNDYALDYQNLQDLIELSRRLLEEGKQHFSLEWILCSEQDKLQLYLTQFTPERTPYFRPPPMALEQSSVLVTGMPASPGRVIAPAMVIFPNQKPRPAIPPGSILVTQGLTSDWLPLLQHSIGIVLETGGMTSHGAIIARELGIPALVGATQATHQIQTGELILLDATRGEVYRYTGNSDPLEEPENPETEGHFPLVLRGNPSPRTEESDEAEHDWIGTQLWVNVSQPDLAEEVAQCRVDGVGLLRAEMMMMGLLHQQSLAQWLADPQALVDGLRQGLERFAAAFKPRPIFYRTTDWRFPEYPALGENWQGGANPLMGLRGTYHYQFHPALFEAELKALQAIQGRYGNFRVILPFVRSVAEFRYCRDRLAEIGLLRSPTFQLWIMAEVPSVLFLLGDYIEAGVQGIAIGTNDLSQLLLGVDRENPPLAQFYDQDATALKRMLQQLITQAHTYQIPCSICGQGVLEIPDFVDHLVQWGVTALSVEPHAIESTYQTLARAEKRLLLAAARVTKANGQS
ncbi:putative PEP-binding protein [Spirulina subsalsa]|uniref:putative PEP-binding protein n=1 Tax=Spirulina subsalsa TaxID=54311 RepID=UPI0002FB0DB2|nr:putative PEP-binding protein [Spirulina subsalsa]